MNANLKITKPVEDEKHTVDVGGRGYEVILHPDTEDGGYWVECPELSGCASEGDTREEALYMIKDAIEGYLAVLKIKGSDPFISPRSPSRCPPA